MRLPRRRGYPGMCNCPAVLWDSLIAKISTVVVVPSWDSPKALGGVSGTVVIPSSSPLICVVITCAVAYRRALALRSFNALSVISPVQGGRSHAGGKTLTIRSITVSDFSVFINRTPGVRLESGRKSRRKNLSSVYLRRNGCLRMYTGPTLPPEATSLFGTCPAEPVRTSE